MKTVFRQSLEWYFYDKPKMLLRAWFNYLRFYLKFFSILLLLKTLFSPWRKYEWVRRTRGFNPKEALEIHFSNLISRILGAVVRLFMIFIGLLVEFFVFFIGIGVLVGWFFLPAIMIVVFINAVELLY